MQALSLIKLLSLRPLSSGDITRHYCLTLDKEMELSMTNKLTFMCKFSVVPLISTTTSHLFCIRDLFSLWQCYITQNAHSV